MRNEYETRSNCPCQFNEHLRQLRRQVQTFRLIESFISCSLSGRVCGMKNYIKVISCQMRLEKSRNKNLPECGSLVERCELQQCWPTGRRPRQERRKGKSWQTWCRRIGKLLENFWKDVIIERNIERKRAEFGRELEIARVLWMCLFS